ncbi:peptidase T [Enterococcus casseliflavus]|mgnify:FL=1|uniref:peptidase T n=1 Tax=Enterococcus casseliflavus TaxID=37734 RepID=UPI000EAFE7A2|nr:peptidase T [Enterococcus casseliflavus]AYJ45946.1 peptidase T [Enterococcus casseliflavus]MBS5815736.1 peptidase T [Enterococcus casseliflavus]MCD4963763.1 peptidase T [Enterococcus casseliflavus]MDT2980007.1 peptidase T [Enterococcus casseliflavus]MDU3373177.1 peptidase T [Enterococcus casseliflavus]
MYENLLPRFLKYVKTETRSDATSTTTPSTQTQVAFAKELQKELEELGLSDVHYNESNGFVIATLPSNVDHDVRSIGFIAHMDTADFNAENVDPQIIENYDGESTIKLDKEGKYTLNTKDFPNLKNYAGETLITTDGTTLLGSDDKSGIAEIMTAMEILLKNPTIKHGEIKVAFGPDEEIGVGADKFDVEDFNVDFAYTMDGGPVGELQYETFNAAQAEITIQGKNVHPGTAKDTMINALQLAVDFQNALPADEVPEKTEGTEGFFHLMSLSGSVEEAKMAYIIRDHDRSRFEERKAQLLAVQESLNARFDEPRVHVHLYDQYYNMKEIIEKDMSIIDLAKDAMKAVGITPMTEPVRGGTDGSKISYLGIPTPNIFAGGENMHGRYEFVSLQSMMKATDVIVKIVELNAQA